MANQDMLIQIVTMGYGFEVDEIQAALVATNSTSAEAAVEYIIMKKSLADAGGGSGPVTGDQVSPLDEVKRRIREMDLNVPSDKVHRALQLSDNNPNEAFDWILSHMSNSANVQANEIVTSEDAEMVKHRLMQQAVEREKEQAREAEDRARQIEEDRIRFEAEEKSREEAAELHQLRMQENREAIVNAKKNKKKQNRTKRLEWHLKQEAYDAVDQGRLDSVRANRLEAESKIDGPDNAIKGLYERYGENTAMATLILLWKIITKVVENPTEDRFRTVDLTNRNIQNKLVSPLGALLYLKILGFEEVGDTLTLPENAVNIEQCQQAIAHIDGYLTYEVSPVVETVQQCEESKEFDLEDLYMAIVVTHEYLRNLLISPQAEHLRLINVDSEHFKNRVGRFPPFIRLFKNLGYTLTRRTEGRFLMITLDMTQSLSPSTHPQLRVLKGACRDLKNANKRLLNSTHVVECVTKLREVNPTHQMPLERLFSQMSRAVDRILDEPLEMKYQKISLTKLKRKYDGVKGVISLLRVVGFNTEDTTAAGAATVDGAAHNRCFTLEAPIDFDLLKMRKDMLNAVIARS